LSGSKVNASNVGYILMASLQAVRSTGRVVFPFSSEFADFQRLPGFGVNNVAVINS
jgi:hypothetical protein